MKKATYMKIAEVHENLFDGGGAENNIIWYSSKLVDLGYDLTIFTGSFNPGTGPKNIFQN